MMLEYWHRISYMVQLLAACTVFILPIKKRDHVIRNYMAGAIILVLSSFIANTFLDISFMPIITMIYWLSFILVAIFFVWACLDISFWKAMYLALCACGLQHLAYDIYLILTYTNINNLIVWGLIYAVIYIIGYFLCARALPDDEGSVSTDKYAILPMVTIIVIVWILSVAENDQTITIEGNTSAEINQMIFYRILDALCCFYILWVQVSQRATIKLQREVDHLNALWRQQKNQYDIANESIERINQKCHDLKYQIRGLNCIENDDEREKYMHDLENDIMIYDTYLETGNKALDTILMEKGLYCQNHQIQWSCMADGSRLDFIEPEDIYVIFGNALDNAIEAVSRLESPDKKIITIKIIMQEDIQIIQIQNYYSGEITFKDGLPQTVKENKQDHGYGLKSIQNTTEKYNGTITVETQNDIFTLQILIPIP